MKYAEKFGFVCLAPLALAAFGAVAVPTAAQAQAQAPVGLSEVVVTAERRTTSVQKTAASVTIRTGDELNQEGRQTLREIVEATPGILGGEGRSGGSGTDSIASGLLIRGIPSNEVSGSSLTAAPASAAYYVDGVLEGIGGNYDVERVEILRGPQGTLYGRSATSGLVAVHTKDPKLGDFGFDVGVEGGNFNLKHYDGALNVPIGDKVAIRISGNRYERDGFDHPSFRNSVDTKAGRIKLLFQPTDTLSILAGYSFQDSNTTSGGVQPYLSQGPDTVEYRPTDASTGWNRYKLYWSEINWDLGFAQLSYQPSFKKWASNTVLYQRGIFIFDQAAQTPKDDFWTHEVLLSSNPDSRLQWQMGVFYYHNELSNNLRLTYPASGALNTQTATQRETREIGLFTEVTYPISDTFRVTGGLRYDETQVSTDQVYTRNNQVRGATATALTNPNYALPEIIATYRLQGGDGERTYRHVNYKLRAEYDLTPQNLLYGMVSTASSPGDVSLSRNAANVIVPLELESESVIAYEIGSKNRFWDNRLQINAAAYYNDYGGYQTNGINGNLGNDADPILVTLVAPMRSMGVELESIYKPTADDRLSLNVAYTNSEFTDRSQRVPNTVYTFATFYGKSEVPDVVPWVVQGAYNRTFHPFDGGRLTVGGSVRYLSEHDAGRILASQVGTIREAYVRNDGIFLADLNAQLSFMEGKYSINGWIRNVGDTRYKTAVSAFGTNINTSTLTPSAPRTYGLSLRLSF